MYAVPVERFSCVFASLFAEIANVIVGHAQEIEARIGQTGCESRGHTEGVANTWIVATFGSRMRIGKNAFQIAESYIARLEYMLDIDQFAGTIAVGRQKFFRRIMRAEHDVAYGNDFDGVAATNRRYNAKRQE